MSDKNLGPDNTYLDPTEKSFETVVFKRGKPVSHAELNLIQDIQGNYNSETLRRLMPSGFLTGDFSSNNYEDFEFGMEANTFELVGKPKVHVNGWIIPLEYTDTVDAGKNKIELPGPIGGPDGNISVDFVFVEVWRSLVEANPSTDNKPALDKIWPHGNVLAPTATWLDDDLLDPPVIANMDPGETTTRRVQIQYALRTVRLDGETRDGYSDVNVEAQGPNATATTLTFSAHGEDPGLWIAGDGDPDNDLNTVDGYVYSIPVAMVWRRNSSDWDADSNGVGGGLISSGTPTRPDGIYADQIIMDDVYDLRHAVLPKTPEWQRIMEKSTSLLLDNELRSWVMGRDQAVEWEVANAQTFGNRFLKCDVILPWGNTSNKGNEIRHFDGICTVFSDRSHVQRHVIEFDALSNAAGANWDEGDTLVFTLPSVEYFNNGPSTGREAFITDVISVVINDVDGGSALFDVPFSDALGLGTDEVTIRIDDLSFTSDADIWVEYEVTYLAGGGLTSIVKDNLDDANFNFIIESGTEPADYADLEVLYEEGPHREVEVQWRPLTDRVLDTFVVGTDQVILPELPYITDPLNPDTSFTVTVDGNADTVASVDRRALTLSSAHTEGDVVGITFTPLKPLPSTSKVFLYYLAPSIQALPQDLLPATLDIEPLFIPSYLYTGTASSGSVVTPFPYEAPLNQIPVSGGAPASAYQGEQSLSAPGPVSVDSFDALTGLLKLPVMVPMVDVDTISLEVPAKNTLEEIGHYRATDDTEYFPSVFSQSLSSEVTHKAFMPVVARLKEDTSFGRKGTAVLVIMTQYFDRASENKITFGDNIFVCAGIYRLKGNWLTHHSN